MALEILAEKVPGLWPITRDPGAIRVAGLTVAERIRAILSDLDDRHQITVRSDFLPSAALAESLRGLAHAVVVRDPADGADLLRLIPSGVTGAPVEMPPDEESLRIRHPWDLLNLNERLVGAMTENRLEGTVRSGATLDGCVILGRNSVILPGVYIEGNVIIGENCKIGPNCYIRGNTAIGDRCHIGQAVEVKNCLIGEHVAIGHLSYVGDSVIMDNVNFGAGTIVSNLRHDGRNHRWLHNHAFLDTGRRKFGAIIGENVHTGIHTAIYPGRSLSENSMTVPGEVVSHSK